MAARFAVFVFPVPNGTADAQFRDRVVLTYGNGIAATGKG